MQVTDKELGRIVDSAIAYRGDRRKDWAVRLAISPTAFSMMLHGKRTFPKLIRHKLIEELGLAPVLASVEACLSHVELE